MELHHLVVFNGQVVSRSFQMRNLAQSGGEANRENNAVRLSLLIFIFLHMLLQPKESRPHLHEIAGKQAFADVGVVVLAGKLCADASHSQSVNESD